MALHMEEKKMNNEDVMKVIKMLWLLVVILVIANAFQTTVCDFQWPDIGRVLD